MSNEVAITPEMIGRAGQPPLVLCLNAKDDVLIALRDIAPGTSLSTPNSGEIVTAVQIPAGHKVAVRQIAAGSPVRRYNQIIGFASRQISPGDHVHVHNLAMAASSATTLSVPTPVRNTSRQPG